MRRCLPIGCFLFLSGAGLVFPGQNVPQAAPQKTLSPATGEPNGAAVSAPTLRTVVLDPAHGGLDTGARGANGVAEKDIVLDYARVVAAALRAKGLQVVMTRDSDTDPSHEARARIANAQTDAIFISLHVASTGQIGTARTYTYPFPSSTSAANRVPPAVSGRGTAEVLSAAETPAILPPKGFLLWRKAQEPYVAQSRKLGDLIQVELAQEFQGSPEISSSVPVYGLRSIAAPAAAVELSSVAADPQQLEAMASPLADAITRAVLAYQTIYPPGGK